MKMKYFGFVILFILGCCLIVNPAGQETLPVADAGLSKYAALEPIILDGTRSYDPLGSTHLFFLWHQVSGPTLLIKNGASANPTISGFIQTTGIQECKFRLVVSSAGRTSLPSFVSIFIVPFFGKDKIDHVNPPFDPDKPTIFSFGGGNCVYGGGMIFPTPTDWFEKANFITVNGYDVPYEMSGDMFIVYLSKMAPGYQQSIQTIGYSTGGNPAIIIANYLNQTYKDPRYAVNRVSLFDAPCIDFPAEVADFNAHPIAGEITWVDNYMVSGLFVPGAMNIIFPGGEHHTPVNWFSESALTAAFPGEDVFNNGVTAGAFLSVIGPAKNLQMSTDKTYYYFKWNNADPDFLEFLDTSKYPGRLPEPVVLMGTADGTVVDDSGALLTCKKSANAVGYQLLFGAEPGQLNHLVSDTPEPPVAIIKSFPYETTYWTIKARDRFGSTIFADPRSIDYSTQKIKPAVSISAPANDSIAAGEVEIRAEAVDDSGINKVDFSVDGALKYSADSAPYNFNWDTTSYLSESHVLKVTAYSNTGSFNSAWIALKVRNFIISLEASRGIERGWIIQVEYGKLDITIENPGNIRDVKFIIYKSSNGRVFQPIAEFSDSQIQGGVYSYYDKSLQKEKLYSYKVIAKNSQDRITAFSEIRDI